MLRNTNDLQGYAIQATDGPIGHVKDFYFDDKAWVIRYLIVDTGTWLSSREVLVSPMALGQPNWSDKLLPASMTKEQVKNSPDIDTNKPVSRHSPRRLLCGLTNAIQIFWASGTSSPWSDQSFKVLPRPWSVVMMIGVLPR